MEKIDLTVAHTPPRLFDQVRAKIRLNHYSLRTEDAYVDWAKRFENRSQSLRYPHISRGRISDLQPPRVDRSARMAQSSR